ncbi:MAG TPA: RagB/SusD family nutrient uptake outer membrane protein, partial [Gemmatimonadaceae bacterium]|nr:RagB/SusD family nutrient uptake outer membrane protein [Gemmatimonadaceae bacterium]
DGSSGTPNVYESQLPGMLGCGMVNMSDREGENGLNFVSAQDPRLVVDSTVQQTCDGGTWYYPAKFGNPSQYVPLATGVEARLIAAEAALQGGDASTWAADLNALRAAAPSTYLQLDSAVRAMKTDPTGVDSLHPTQDQAVDILFRERAFWLYGTGTRQADLRRLIRQYGRDQNTVFPSGPFANGNNPNLLSPLPSYGTDVSFTLPTAASGNTTTNPNYKGCLVPTSTG